MRSQFVMQLSELNNNMISIGMLCETAITKSSKALLACDPGLAREVPDLLGQITEREREIEGICLKLLLHQQPVARDFRTVSSALKMVTDAQRIGTQSAEVAKLIMLGNLCGLPESMPIPEMVNAVLKMVTESIDSFVRQDVKTAISVIEYDDVVDNYFNACKSTLIRLLQGQAVNSEAAVDLLLIAKYYERIGDHAVNIAKRLLFAITGSHDPDGMQ